MLDKAATLAAYASCGFILLPAGRDMFSHTTPILPGEDVTRPMMVAANPKARRFMWGLWGFNHCLVTGLKLLAIHSKDALMLKVLAGSAVVTMGYCVAGQRDVGPLGGDLKGFVAVCAVQVLSLGYLAYKA